MRLASALLCKLLKATKAPNMPADPAEPLHALGRKAAFGSKTHRRAGVISPLAVVASGKVGARGGLVVVVSVVADEAGARGPLVAGVGCGIPPPPGSEVVSRPLVVRFAAPLTSIVHSCSP